MEAKKNIKKHSTYMEHLSFNSNDENNKSPWSWSWQYGGGTVGQPLEDAWCISGARGLLFWLNTLFTQLVLKRFSGPKFNQIKVKDHLGYQLYLSYIGDLYV